jgi:hypothetical protein
VRSEASKKDKLCWKIKKMMARVGCYVDIEKFKKTRPGGPRHEKKIWRININFYTLMFDMVFVFIFQYKTPA